MKVLPKSKTKHTSDLIKTSSLAALVISHFERLCLVYNLCCFLHFRCFGHKLNYQLINKSFIIWFHSRFSGCGIFLLNIYLIKFLLFWEFIREQQHIWSRDGSIDYQANIQHYLQLMVFFCVRLSRRSIKLKIQRVIPG